MKRVFEHSSVFPGTASRLTAVHALPQTFARLTMPPLVMQVVDDRRTSLTGGDIAFRLWFGPFPVNWLARHEAGVNEYSFKDVQVRGPLETWEHEHVIEPDEKGARLTDRITFSHKPGIAGLLTRLLFDGLPLKFLFLYRHLQTRRMLKSLAAEGQSNPGTAS